MKFVFNENISGSNNGIDIIDYKEGQVIDEKDISKTLLDAWTERGVVSPEEEQEGEEEDVDNSDGNVDNSQDGEGENADGQGEEGQGDVDNSGEDVNNNTSNTGNEEVDNFLNGKTDKVPEGTEEVTEEEALILEAKAIFEKVDEEHPLDTDRLKEIGIALNIPNMNKTVNPEKIEEKMKKYLEEKTEKEDGEGENADGQGEEGQGDVDNSGEDVNNNTSNTGNEEVDNFLNGKTDKVPEGTEEVTEEEALILEAKAIFEKVDEEHPLDTDRLKEIGIALNIPNMNKTVNPEKIEEKMKKYLEEKTEKEDGEGENA